MHDKLLSRIRPVTRRMRAVRWWKLAALVALAAALIGVVMLRYAQPSDESGYRIALALLSGTIVLFVVAGLIVRASFRNPRGVAARIEQRFPSLDQRLLTALSQIDVDERELGYLQRRVMTEARDHSRTHRWTDVVPPRSLLWSRLSGMAATLLLAVVLGLLVMSDPVSKKQTVGSRSKDAWQIVVEPGSTEVERGSSLVVTARFSGADADAVPEEADLVCTAADGSERRITMTRNLVDPVVAGFLASVNEKFTYQIIGSDWQSETYSVDVFEFPSLVRSDANLDYPDYTGLNDKRVEDTVRVSAVEGTQLKWICFINKPVPVGALVAPDGERIALQADPEFPGTLTANVELRENGRWIVELVDDAGRENKYPPELVARVLPNQPPTLKLTAAGDVTVSPLEELPIAAEVRDDFGITEVGLTFTFAGQPRQDMTLDTSIARGEKKLINYLIEFESLGAEPDQLLSYHVWADDYGPDGEVRRTESDLYFAEVRPFEEIFREGEPPPQGQSQQPPGQTAQQVEELAGFQKEIINATWSVLRRERGEQRSAEFADNMLLLKESQTEAIERLEALAEKIGDAQSLQFVDVVRTQMQTAVRELTAAETENRTGPLDPALIAEQAAYGALLKLRAREFEVTRSQQRQQQGSSSSAAQRRQQQLDELELDQDENRYETQQQAEETQQQQEQREVRQVLNRLRELAKRQEDLNKELAQLQSALEQAETEQQKEEIQRQLKRLRDQQQDLLRETDELSERMQQPENQESMQEASEQLEETRENVRQAADALDKEDASEALTSGKRAEREFEEMRDEFRRRAAGQFNDAVREMRNEAQELDQQQEQVAEQLNEIGQDDQPGLRGEDKRQQILDALDGQRERLGELLEQMQETVEEAETAEPLLAQKLYDSYRKTRQRQVDERLRDTSELLERGFDAQAREIEQAAGEGIDELREELEEAAESVLGNETEALSRALGELERLSRDLDEEIERSDPNRQSQQTGPRGEESDPQESRQPGEAGDRQSQQPGQGDQQQRPQGAHEAQRGQGNQQGQPREGQPADDPQQSQESQPGRTPGQGENPSPGESPPPGASPTQSQSPGQGDNPTQDESAGEQSQPSESSTPSPSPAGQPNAARPSQSGQQPGGQPSQQATDGPREGSALSQYAANNPAVSPLTGDGFQDWSDRLRDVEEMVENPELRSQAARIRDRAREVRIDYRRHSKGPQWPLVEKLIAEPLRELKREVAEELMRRSADKHAPVPIDRDPVPAEFTEAVRKYYESLGSGL